ncbi:MAG: molybdopterin-dependent oxidoreductase [Jiangellaceae bacterium]|nr:molybdopterin-dependent oxidoreductase [Jiangellaceae bacterium]
MLQTPTGPPAVRRAWRTAWPGALAGVAAAALGLGAAELGAGVLGRATTPVIAVGEAFIDRVPPWLKDLAVAWFGTADKAVLIAAVLAVLTLLSVGVGMLAVRHHAAGLAAAAGLGLVATLAVWTRPDATMTDLWPPALGTGVSVLALDWLTRRAAASEPPSNDRRAFVKASLIGVALATVSYATGRWLGLRRSSVEESRRGVGIDTDTPEPPTGADVGVDGAVPWQTPNPVFYRIDTALSVPLLRAEDWRLRVHGLVAREVTLDFDQLLALGLVERWITLTCVSNEVGGYLAGNAVWSGVRVADVLALAEPQPDADAVKSTSADGFTVGTPLAVLTDGRDALFAVGMNGEPLPVEHGFPVRMVVPGLYGYVSATKWVVDVELSRFDAFDAYWTTRGWSEQAPVKVSSRIEVPARGARVNAGRVPVAGTAWAQHRGIQAVEVRVDGGSWQRAQLGVVPSADTWRQWVWEWDARPGEHLLEVRAVTADGEVQTGALAPPPPDGATGWHQVTVEVQ